MATTKVTFTATVDGVSRSCRLVDNESASAPHWTIEFDIPDRLGVAAWRALVDFDEASSRAAAITQEQAAALFAAVYP